MKIRHGQGPRLSFNFLRRPCRLLKREFSHAPQPLVEPMKTMVFRSLCEWKMKHFESLQVSCEKIAKNCKNHLKFVFWPLKCPRRVQQAISDVIWPITRPCTLTESYSRICQNHHFLSSKMARKGSIREVFPFSFSPPFFIFHDFHVLRLFLILRVKEFNRGG